MRAFLRHTPMMTFLMNFMILAMEMRRTATLKQ